MKNVILKSRWKKFDSFHISAIHSCQLNIYHTLLIKIIFSLQKFQNQGKKTGPEKQPGGTKTKKNESSKSRRGNHHVDDDGGGKILHESMLLKIQSMN